MSVPDRFEGMLAQFPPFFGQFHLFMSLHPEDFQMDQDKVGFIISLLTGPAARWAILLLMWPSLLLDYYVGFCVQLISMFSDLVKAQMVNRWPRELKQGQCPVAEYISGFHLMNQDLKWNEEALIDQFLGPSGRVSPDRVPEHLTGADASLSLH